MFLLKFTINSKRLIIYHDNIICLHIEFSPLYFRNIPAALHGQRNFLVFEICLLELFKICNKCLGRTKREVVQMCAGADPGGRTRRAPPLKLEKIWFVCVKSWFFTRNTSKMFAPPSAIGKNMIFWRKIVIFHTKYPKYFRASLRSAQLCLCAPP